MGRMPTSVRRPISRGWVVGRAVVDRRTIHVHDLAAEVDSEYPGAKAFQRQTGHRTTLATPLLREGVALGAILVRRMEVLPFSEKQVRLLETFADQAVIAIENVRLFTELEARNRELTRRARAADRDQRAPSGDRPVSPSISSRCSRRMAENAVRLCEAERAFVHRFDGQVLEDRVGPATSRPSSGVRRAESRSAWPPSVAARAGLERRVVHIHDALADPELTLRGEDGRSDSARSWPFPMLRAEELLGVDHVYRARGVAVHGQADRAPRDLRRSGRDRHRERAAVHGAGGAEPRPHRGAGAADGDRARSCG